MAPGISSVKEYTNQATQTNLALQAQPGPPEINPPISLLVIDSDKHNPMSSNSSVLIQESGRELPRAYSHPDRCLPVPNQVQPVIHSANEPRNIPYNRPSFFHGNRMRTISLPGAVSKVKTIMSSECSPRVVSMTERPKPNTPPSAGSLRVEKCSTDIFSLDNIYDDYRTGAPATPSPPSSPESIMIIGNEPQVPMSFLRHSPVTFPDCLDGDGWTGSPPRPIPALHGPLSLPYARCPSGAEGTLIEHDDLPNMIWGLNVHENQPKPSSRATHLSSQHRGTPSHRPIPAQQRPKRGDKNTLVAPFDEAPAPQRIHQPFEYYKESNESTLDPRRAPDWKIDKANYESPDWNPATPNFKEHSRDWHRGLGIGWEGEHVISGLPTHGNNAVDNLRASAPVFIPGNQHQRSPRIFIGPHRGYITTRGQYTSHGKSHTAYSEANFLPTPPSTVPLQWIPSFSSNPQFQASDIPQDQTSSLPYSEIDPSPLLKEFVEHSMFNIRTLEPEYTPTCPAQAPHTSRQTVPRIHSPTAVPIDVLYEACSPYPVPPPNTLPPILEKLNANHDQQACDLSVGVETLPLLFMNRTRSFSQQYPRSIPLARLIQRRLSSVPEEDMRSSANNPPRLGDSLFKEPTNEPPMVEPATTPISITPSANSTCKGTTTGTKKPSNLQNHGSPNHSKPARTQQCIKDQENNYKSDTHEVAITYKKKARSRKIMEK